MNTRIALIIAIVAASLHAEAQSSKNKLSVATLAELQARTPQNGEIVEVRNHSTNVLWEMPIDFRHVAGSEDAADGLFVLTNAGGIGRYLASDYGAKEFKVTRLGADPTGVMDSRDAVQSAIDALSTSGGTVYFPGGTYRLGSGVTVADNVRLLGGGATILTEQTTYCMAVEAGSSNVVIEGLRFDGNNLASRGINIATNAQATILDCEFARFKEDPITPNAALAVVARSGVDLSVLNSYFHDISTSSTNGAGDAVGMSRAIYVTTQSASDEPPPRRVLVQNCRFENIRGTEDSDAIVVQGGPNWATNVCNVVVRDCVFTGVDKRALKATAGGASFVGNRYTNSIASTNFGAVALSFYAQDGYAADNVFVLGNYYSAIDIGAGASYPASGTRIIGNLFKSSGTWYTNSVGVLVDAGGSSNILIQGNQIGSADIHGIRIRSGGEQIKILGNTISMARKTGARGSGVFLGLVDGALPYVPAKNVEVRGNTFEYWDIAFTQYGGFNHVYSDNVLVNCNNDTFFETKAWPGGPSSTNSVAVTNQLLAKEWSWYTGRERWWDGSKWVHHIPVSEGRSAAGGVTNGQWYRIAVLEQPVSVSTHPRGGARMIVGNQGGNLLPTRTVFEIDHSFSGLGVVNLVANTAATDSPWKAVRTGYTDYGGTNRVAWVDVQANGTSAGAITVLVEDQPLVLYPEHTYQWRATNVVNIPSLGASDYSYCTLTNLNWLSSGYHRYDSYGYEDWGLGVLWQTPRWTTTERDAFTHQRAGSFGWNSTAGRLQVYNGSSWMDVGSAGLTNTVVMVGGTNTVIGPDFTGIPGVSHGYFGIASSNQIIFQLWSHGVPLDRLATNGAAPGNPIVFNGVDYAPTNALSVVTLNAGTLGVSNRISAQVVSNATPSRVAVWGADNILSNAPATTGTGSPVFSDSPAMTGTPTVPTAAPGTSNTTAASTAFVTAAVAAGGSGGGLGTNAFVNGVLKQPVKFTNAPALTGGVIWITNSSGDVQAYATNVASGGGDAYLANNQQWTGTNNFATATANSPAAGDNGTNLVTSAWVRAEFDQFVESPQFGCVVLDFVGGTGNLALQPATYTSIGSGNVSISNPDGSSYKKPGMKGIAAFTTATGAGISTGAALYLAATTQFVHTNVSQMLMYAAIVRTNQQIGRFGWGDSVGTGQDTDAFGFSLTNNTVIASAINNSTETMSTNTFAVAPDQYYLWSIAATNNTMTCTIKTNGVTIYTGTVSSGLPVADPARLVAPMIRAWNGAAANTNGVPILAIDRLAYKWTWTP